MYDYNLIHRLNRRSQKEKDATAARVWIYKYGGKVAPVSQEAGDLEAWSKLLDPRHINCIPGYKSSGGKQSTQTSGEINADSSQRKTKPSHPSRT